MNLPLPLRLRDFRLLWTGMSLSLLGDGLLLVALAWQAYELAGQQRQQRVTLAVLFVPGVRAPERLAPRPPVMVPA